MRFSGILLALATMVGLPGCRQSQQSSVAPILQSPQRSADDRERDARSRPDVVVAMLDLKPGDRVLDVLAGGGYYSQILAGVVGQRGRVLAHNNRAYHRWVGPNIEGRFANLGLDQVTIYDRELDNLELESESLDAILMVAAYHDLYFVDTANDWPPVDANRFMQQIVDGLAPGGRLVIVDHHAAAGRGRQDAQELHRIERTFAIEDWQRYGLQVVGIRDALEQPNDPLNVSVFDPVIRGKTSRFIVAFEKP